MSTKKMTFFNYFN